MIFRKISLSLILLSTVLLFWTCASLEDPRRSKTFSLMEHPAPPAEYSRESYGLDGDIYFVSSDKGDDSFSGLEESRPLKSIQAAIDKSAPGDIIYVMNGVYTNKPGKHAALFRDNRGGTAEHWKMLAAYPGHRPLIRFDSWSGITVEGSSYIIITGFDIEGAAARLSRKDAERNYQKENKTEDSLFINNGIGVSYVWNDSSKRSHHVIISDNRVYNCCGAGIYTHMADYVTIENNISCYNAYWSAIANSGISTYQNWNSDFSIDYKMVIRGNICYSNYNFMPFFVVGTVTDGNGIIVDDSKHTQHDEYDYMKNERYMGRTLIENNICFDNGARGIHIYESEHVTIRHNTLFRNMRHPEINGGDMTAGESFDIHAHHNIIYSGGEGNYPFQNFGSSSIRLERNVYYGGEVQNPGPGPGDLPDSDPLFIKGSINPLEADFRLQEGSPALDKVAVSATQDISGATRPRGFGTDCGAWERE